jgi:actin-related protein
MLVVNLNSRDYMVTLFTFYEYGYSLKSWLLISQGHNNLSVICVLFCVRLI